MKYALKPKVIDATQWHPGVALPGAIGAPDGKSVFVHTSAGKVKLQDGDYVLGSNGHYACVMGKAAFEDQYEEWAASSKEVAKIIEKNAAVVPNAEKAVDKLLATKPKMPVAKPKAPTTTKPASKPKAMKTAKKVSKK